ncbi:unnamed protein product [Mytilus coruscus]|uniref:Uncharacterized protein n=1 Tax=Mytilus coruscus TaxID=42192 RepID=A0A6J8BUI4_MYTCO|nr:unnamed protein product [Mytilus coruscus]
MWCRGAKKKFTYTRKEMGKTGGGPPPTHLSIAEENIVNEIKDSASFSGVGGIETNITCNGASPDTNESQSPCKATPRPTTEESVLIRALDRHHSNLQNNQQTCSVADDAEGTDRNGACPGQSSSASSQSQTKRSPSSCRISISSLNILGASPDTNESQSPCKATPRPTTEESVLIRALDRHHSNLQNNQQTCSVADDAEGTDRNGACPGQSSSASSQSQTKRSPSSCR